MYDVTSKSLRINSLESLIISLCTSFLHFVYTFSPYTRTKSRNRDKVTTSGGDDENIETDVFITISFVTFRLQSIYESSTPL